MAKQFRLDQMVGYRAAIDGNKGFAVALGLTVQCAGDQFLARTALATNQDGRLGGCKFAHHRAQVAHRAAVTQQLILWYIGRGCRLSAQARHAKGPAECDLHPGDIEGQRVKVKKPFTDKIPDIAHFQDIRGQRRNPLGATATDHVFYGFRAFQMKRLQPQQANVARTVDHRCQRAAVYRPADGAQAREQLVTIFTGVNHQ